jgi:hypothetical protein
MPDAEFRNNADPFREMAQRIEANKAEKFAGAACIVPPDGAKALEILLLTEADPAMFWSLLKTKCDLRIQELANEEAQRQTGWGMRR